MASVRECEAAVSDLLNRLDQVDGDTRRRHAPDRTVSCCLVDLDLTYSARLHEGELIGLTTDPSPPAQVRLTVTSDDLVALANGDLTLGNAWSAGRLKVEASILDLLRLRAAF